MFDLIPANNQKSFYGKAKVIVTAKGLYLKSYDTFVAFVDKKKNFYRLWDGYSATTAKHIHSFRIRLGLAPMGKKEWENLKVYDELPFFGNGVK